MCNGKGGHRFIIVKVIRLILIKGSSIKIVGWHDSALN